MAGNVSGLHQFANDVGPIPLSLLDLNYAALTTALNTLNTFSTLYQDIGTQNALNIQTPAGQFVSYADGLTLQVRPAAANTGPATLNINALGPVQIINNDGSALTGGEIVPGRISTFTYDAQRNAFILGVAGGGGSGGGGGIPPPGSTLTGPLSIAGAVNQDVLRILQAQSTTSDNAGIAVFQAGAGNGIFIKGQEAAPAPAQYLLMAEKADGTQFFVVSANGSGSLGVPPNQLAWSSTGAWTLPPNWPPSGGGGIVNTIVAGTGISVSPPGGSAATVTITATGGGVSWPLRGSGNASPQSQPAGGQLQLYTADGNNTSMQIDAAGATATPALELRRMVGTMASPSMPTSGAALGALRILGWTGSGFAGGGMDITVAATSTTWSVSTQGTSIAFNTTADNETVRTRKMFIGGTRTSTSTFTPPVGGGGGLVLGRQTTGQDMGEGSINVASGSGNGYPGIFINGINLVDWLALHYPSLPAFQ